MDRDPLGRLDNRLAKLGAYFVMTKVLLSGLSVAILLIAGLILALVWMAVRGKSSQ